MCITITVGETGRRVMGMSTMIINVVLIFLSLILFVAALGIRYKLDKRLEILDGYDSGALPYYLMFTAGVMFLCHLVAAKFCHDATYPATRSNKHHIFLSVIFVVIGLCIFVIISEIVLLVHGAKIRSALEEGIGNSMASYKSDLDRKERIDKLQIEYQCCGAYNYKEWFHIGWVNMIYVDVESDRVKPFIKDGEFIKDDAPFSCCSIRHKRACIHNSVQGTNEDGEYNSITLNNIGCVDALMNYFKSTLLTPTAILLLVVIILQIVDIAVMRLLQTSIFTADEMNDPEGATYAYCIKGLGGGGDNRDYFKRKSSSERLAAGGSDDDYDEEDETSDDNDGGGTSKPKRHDKKKGKQTSDTVDDDDDSDDDKGKEKKKKNKKDKKKEGGDAGDDDDDDKKKKKKDKDKDKKDKKGKKGKEDKEEKKKKKKDETKKDKKGKDKKKKDDKAKKAAKKTKPGKAKKPKKSKPKKSKPKKSKPKKSGGKKGKKK